MSPRAGGGLVLLLALLSVLVVPRILNPPTVSGVALKSPPPPPPAVGTCLAGGSDGYSTDGDGIIQQSGPVQIVNCSDPHKSEVLYVEADVAPTKVTTDNAFPLNSVLDACYQSSGGAWSYIGLPELFAHEQPPPGVWSPYATFSLSLIGPSTDERIRGSRWVACVLVTLTAVDEPLPDIASRAGGIPPELGTCFAGPRDSDPWAQPQDCTQPHRTELVANTNLGSFIEETSVSPAPTRSELTASCEAVAVAATQRPQLLSEPSPTTQVFAYVIGENRSEVVSGELPADAQGWAECVITTTNPDQNLDRSLRLIGDSPLPWRP